MVRTLVGTRQIPKYVALAIKKCWPEGVVEEFATDESYFHDIHPRLERDLRNIRGASLLWQTSNEEIAGLNNGENDEPQPSDLDHAMTGSAAAAAISPAQPTTRS